MLILQHKLQLQSYTIIYEIWVLIMQYTIAYSKQYYVLIFKPVLNN